MNEMTSIEFPPALQRLDAVLAGVWRQGRWSMTIDGIDGWCVAVAQPPGLCVGCQVDVAPIDSRWLEQACLWLMSLRGVTDDALWLDAANALVFVRRHDTAAGSAALRVSLEQQIAIARWLGAHHAALEEAPRTVWRPA
ncbi:hypothetical protein [Burkholderia pyrrocinia]